MHAQTTSRGWLQQGALALSALLLLLGLAGCAQRPAAFPTGTFTTTIAEADVGDDISEQSMVGEWKQVFHEDGTFEVIRHDVEVIKGTYTISGDQIVGVDKSGLYLGSKEENRWTYRWNVDQDGSLAFTAVDDQRADRKLIMESHHWAKAP